MARCVLVKESAEIDFKIKSEKLKKKHLNINLILGRNWIKQNVVRMYFDIGRSSEKKLRNDKMAFML